MATKAKPKLKVAPVAAVKATKPLAVRKPALKVVPTAKVSPKAKAPPKAKAAAKVTSSISADQRRNYIEVAAFFIAERRGLAPGDLIADWLEAEAQVNRLIAEGKIGS